MRETVKRKWVKALMSGDYTQGNGYLYYDGTYCCLGVLLEAALVGEPGPRPYLECDERLKAGITVDEQRALAKLNDEGVPFEIIAGLINESL